MDKLIFTASHGAKTQRIRVSKSDYNKISEISHLTGMTATAVLNKLLYFALDHTQVNNICPAMDNGGLL